MRQARGMRHGRCVSAKLRQALGMVGLGSVGSLVAGCMVVGGAAAALAVFLLTGVFLGAIQASFEATARSYGYTDAGQVQFVFNHPTSSRPQLTSFGGRLPGFYFVVINDVDDKAIPRAQADEPVVFTTDVNINFETSPPTLTGTIREIDGEQVFDLFELFPVVESVSAEVTEGDGEDRWDVRLTIVARGVDEEVLEYSVILHTHLTGGGDILEADVEVQRTLTPAGEEPIVIEGEGELSNVSKQQTEQAPDDTTQNDDLPAEDDNADQDATDQETDDGDAGEEPEPDDENADDEGQDDANQDQPANDDDQVDDEGEDAGQQITDPADCVADLSIIPSNLVDEVVAILNSGHAAFDLDDDGTVTSSEVQQKVEDDIAATGFLFPITLPPQNAQCVADILNGAQ